MKNIIEKRSISNKLKLYNAYYKRSGLYKFVIESMVKVMLAIGILVAGLIILNHYFNLEEEFLRFANAVHPAIIFIIFYISETILGLIPPDFFIAWAKSGIFANHWAIVGVLSIISYAGGMTAYKLGHLSRKLPKINAFLEKKFSKHTKLIQKWGGVVVVIAALFPLPFATICLVAGMLSYSFKQTALYGLSRILRFIGYALIIFYFMSQANF